MLWYHHAKLNYLAFLSVYNMKFWKKKDKSTTSTNPFEEQEEQRPSRDSASEYSQTPTATDPFRSRYSNPQPSSFTENHIQDRQDLFRGRVDRTNRFDSNGQEDAYSQSKFAEDDEDQEVAQIQHKIRNVKQDTLASTRNALQKINETEATAVNTMTMLGTQSSKFL
jgi:FtsZ-interacting cell division protein ZipA